METKYYLKIVLSALFLLLTFSSCDEGPDSNSLRVRIITNNTEEPISVYGIHGNNDAEVTVGPREFLYETSADSICISAKCLNPDTEITIKIWVNNHLVTDVVGTEMVTTGIIMLKENGSNIYVPN